jgi:hypothetical protein
VVLPPASTLALARPLPLRRRLRSALRP